jgi:hypothetical protein
MSMARAEWMAIPGCYGVTAAACLAAIYATAPSYATDLLPYTAGPFAVASLALGAAALLRSARGWLEQAIATMWGVGAIAASVNLSSPPLRFQDLFLYFRFQALYAGLAAIAILIAATGRMRGAKDPWQLSHAVALVILGVFLGRRCLMGVGHLRIGGIEAVAFELRLSQVVLLTCSVIVVLTACVTRMRERRM